ncbi:MAG: SRPBCC family protein [Candidatus Micrarchaeota archaeon]|nr:SRPBCC family protein [Candidatus Micrarchaeota archaeon]
MRISLSGNAAMNAPVDKTFKFATTISQVGVCIPNVQDFKQLDGKNFTMNVVTGVAFIKGTFAVKGALTEQGENHVAYSVEWKGVGSTIKVNLSFNMSPKINGYTDVAWTADAEMSGLISGVSESVLRKVTEEKIEEIVANVKARLEKS